MLYGKFHAMPYKVIRYVRPYIKDYLNSCTNAITPDWMTNNQTKFDSKRCGKKRMHVMTDPMVGHDSGVENSIWTTCRSNLYFGKKKRSGVGILRSSITRAAV